MEGLDEMFADQDTAGSKVQAGADHLSWLQSIHIVYGLFSAISATLVKIPGPFAMKVARDIDRSRSGNGSTFGSMLVRP